MLNSAELVLEDRELLVNNVEVVAGELVVAGALLVDVVDCETLVVVPGGCSPISLKPLRVLLAVKLCPSEFDNSRVGATGFVDALEEGVIELVLDVGKAVVGVFGLVVDPSFAGLKLVVSDFGVSVASLLVSGEVVVVVGPGES